MRLLSLVLTTVLAISSQAFAWGHNDHRTYRGPSYGPTYGSTYNPVIIHPIHQTYPVYQPSPVYRPFPVYRPRPFFEVSPIHWRSGYWSHSWHQNRFGWWWVTGNGWSLFSSPSYPYPEYDQQTTVVYESNPEPPPAPQVTVIQQSPPPITQTAPAEPRPSGDTAPPSNTGMYYFCEASQLYYPYARNCSERWTAVSSIPN
jgi:hypothetical protein